MRLSRLLTALLWLAATRNFVHAQERIAVAVFNYAGIPNAALASAADHARLIFHTAGVETEWTVCTAGKIGLENCTQGFPGGGQYLELMVMPKQLAPAPGGDATASAAGFALTRGAFDHPRAYVFYSVTEGIAAKAMRPLPQVMGFVMAHETAHLLGLWHQSSGVMRAYVEPRDIDEAAMGRPFSRKECEQLQARAASAALAMSRR